MQGQLAAHQRDKAIFLLVMKANESSISKAKAPYPQWQHKGFESRLYTKKRRWEYVVYQGRQQGRWSASDAQGTKLGLFNSREEALSACEAHAQQRQAALEAAFQHKVAEWLKDEVPGVALPQQAKSVPLAGPLVRGRPLDGQLTVWRRPKTVSMQWSHGRIEGLYPECELYRAFIEQSGWAALVKALVARDPSPGRWVFADSRWGAVHQISPESAALLFRLLHALYARANRQLQEALQEPTWSSP